MKKEKVDEIVRDFANFLRKIEDNKYLRIRLAKDAKLRYYGLFREEDYHERKLISRKYHNWRCRIRKQERNGNS